MSTATDNTTFNQGSSESPFYGSHIVVDHREIPLLHNAGIDDGFVIPFEEAATDPGSLDDEAAIVVRPGDRKGIAAALRLVGEAKKAGVSGCRIIAPHGWAKGQSLAEFLFGYSDDAEPRLALYAILAGREFDLADMPPNEARDAGPDDWPPFAIGSIPAAPAFPLQVLPDAAIHLCEATADALGCAADFPAVDVLGVAAGVIGKSVSLKLNPGHFASPSVYAAKIGLVGDGKSPSLEIVGTPIREIDDELAAEHDHDEEDWESRKIELGKKRETEAGPQPIPKRLDTNDCTFEKLLEVLAQNPRGIIAIFDELPVLLNGLGQYKSGEGADRAHLLSLWSGASIKVDRKSAGAKPLRVPHPCLAIIGGIQPSKLDSFRPGNGDGLIDRFLFAYPEPRPRPHWSTVGVDDAAIGNWSALIKALWKITQNEKEGKRVPHVIKFTREGEAAWVKNFNQLVDEINAPDFPEHLRGPYIKLQAYAGRLALVLSMLHHVADGGDARNLPTVTAKRVEQAWALVHYFKKMAARVHHQISGGGLDSDTQAIVAWLKRHRPAIFQPGMVSEHLRRFTNRRPALDESLRKLERLGVIRKKESSDKRGRGKPSTVYEVHPKILEPGSGYSANSANCHTEQENPHSGYSANSGNCPEADEYHENPEYAERGSEEKEVRGGMDI